MTGGASDQGGSGGAATPRPELLMGDAGGSVVKLEDEDAAKQLARLQLAQRQDSFFVQPIFSFPELELISGTEKQVFPGLPHPADLSRLKATTVPRALDGHDWPIDVLPPQQRKLVIKEAPGHLWILGDGEEWVYVKEVLKELGFKEDWATENPLRLHMAEDDQRVRRPRIITAGALGSTGAHSSAGADSAARNALRSATKKKTGFTGAGQEPGSAGPAQADRSPPPLPASLRRSSPGNGPYVPPSPVQYAGGLLGSAGAEQAAGGSSGAGPQAPEHEIGLGDAEKVIEDLLNVEHVPLQRKSGSAAGGSSGSGGASVGSEKPRSAGAGTGQGAVPMDRSPVRQSPEPGGVLQMQPQAQQALQQQEQEYRVLMEHLREREVGLALRDRNLALREQNVTQRELNIQQAQQHMEQLAVSDAPGQQPIQQSSEGGGRGAQSSGLSGEAAQALVRRPPFGVGEGPRLDLALSEMFIHPALTLIAIKVAMHKAEEEGKDLHYYVKPHDITQRTTVAGVPLMLHAEVVDDIFNLSPMDVWSRLDRDERLQTMNAFLTAEDELMKDLYGQDPPGIHISSYSPYVLLRENFRDLYVTGHGDVVRHSLLTVSTLTGHDNDMGRVAVPREPRARVRGDVSSDAES